MKRPAVPQKLRPVCLLVAAALVLCLAAVPYGASPVWNRALSLFGLGGFPAQAEGWPAAVHVLDVGKADSILVECGGRFMLVDGGTPDRGKSVVAYLNRRGVKELEAVVNSHPDEDHVGGLKDVLEHFPVKAYYAPSVPAGLAPKDEAYLETMGALRQKGLSPGSPSPGREFSLGGLNVRVLGPVRPGNSTNDCSIVLLLRYGSVRFLLTGDAEQAEEESLLEAGADLSADVLKVGHHGSDTSTTGAFLKAVHPKYAAVSVGYDRNELPKREVLSRLSGAGVRTLRTDVNGTVLFVTDGKTVEAKTEK